MEERWGWIEGIEGTPICDLLGTEVGNASHGRGEAGG